MKLAVPRYARGAGRFAPTPTGDLHLGNARTALLAWLAGRRAGLRAILRVEDLDVGAIPPGCLEGQLADLAWLGLTYDEDPVVGGPAAPYRQSARFDQYARVLAALDARGLLYPCWCSRREVAAAAVAPHDSDEGPVYAGTCRPRAAAPLGDLDDLPTRRGRRPALRVDVAAAMAALDGPVLRFVDQVAGPQAFEMARELGDFVVRRVDGIAAYQIACSWDDVAMGCTQVLRGADLLRSTARQLLILRALGLPEPTYAHVGLLYDAAGNRLAKRDAAVGLAALRAAGHAAADVRRMLARSAGLGDEADLDVLTERIVVGPALAAPARLEEEAR